MSRIVLLLTGLLGFGAQAAAQTLDYQVTLHELEMEHALTSEVVTPHTKWAQPYVLGKTRVLFFTYGHNTDPRECVELMQRFDLEAQAVFRAYIHDAQRTHWHGREVGEERMDDLLEQKWDCFALMGGVSTDEFAAEPLGKLLRQVQEGAGLVLVGTDDSRLLKQENRIVPLPSFLSPGPVGEAFTMGEGRGIRLPARPEIGYYEGWEVDYDYWAERLGRALLWAAGKEPRTGLRITLDRPEFALSELAGNAIGFTWEVAQAIDLTDTKAEMRSVIAQMPDRFGSGRPGALFPSRGRQTPKTKGGCHENRRKDRGRTGASVGPPAPGRGGTPPGAGGDRVPPAGQRR